MGATSEPTVLQTGPETFDVWVGGRRVSVRLAHRTRRGLGLHGVPPVQVAAEMVRFLEERAALPDTGDGAADGEVPVVELGPAAGRFPEFSEELRARLT